MNHLLSFYKQTFNLQNATFFKVEHDDAIVATVYKVLMMNDREYILKICTRPNDYLCEIYFLKFFANKLPVPHIFNSVEPMSDIPGAILMEYLRGDLLKKSELNELLIYEIGSLLAKIHTNKTSGYGDLTKANQLSVNPTSYFIFKFEEGMAECRDHLSTRLLNQSRDLFNDNINLLVSADGPCITHRDFRPGNILVYEGKIQGIIDWSSARGSFAEEDFSFLALEDWSDNDNIKKAFQKGYASIRPVPNYLERMPLLLLSKAIAAIGFTVKTNTWDNKNKFLYERYLKLLESILK